MRKLLALVPQLKPANFVSFWSRLREDNSKIQAAEKENYFATKDFPWKENTIVNDWRKGIIKLGDATV